jgi:predicted dehydrogenase
MTDSTMPLRVGVIGAGRMGRIRALSAAAHPDCQVLHVCDPALPVARSLGDLLRCESSVEWQGILERPDVDAVVVATPHKFLSQIAVAAVKAGKYVFCEKPLARTAAEAEEILNALSIRTSSDLRPQFSRLRDYRVVVGYTLRHHPAVGQAKQLVAAGEIGDLLYVRGRYGHGGRAGYEKEWRGSRDLSGGGELLDQGVHLIDLSRWFLGEFEQVTGFLNSYFWNSSYGLNGNNISGSALLSDGHPPTEDVEDNAFMMLKTSRGQMAMLHASWTQWKNMFSFEVFGTKGFVLAEGLGGSYGQERLVIAKRRPEGGVPDISERLFAQPPEAGTGVSGGNSQPSSTLRDGARSIVTSTTSCWDEEWADFISLVKDDRSGNKEPERWSSASLLDGVQNLKIVDALYRSAARNEAVELLPTGFATAANVR